MLLNTIKRLIFSSTIARDFYSNRITKKMFEVEHLIYNQWCSQYKSDTDS